MINTEETNDSKSDMFNFNSEEIKDLESAIIDNDKPKFNRIYNKDVCLGYTQVLNNDMTIMHFVCYLGRTTFVRSILDNKIGPLKEREDYPTSLEYTLWGLKVINEYHSSSKKYKLISKMDEGDMSDKNLYNKIWESRYYFIVNILLERHGIRPINQSKDRILLKYAVEYGSQRIIDLLVCYGVVL